MAEYKCSTSLRPSRRRHPADVRCHLCPARPTAQRKCSSIFFFSHAAGSSRSFSRSSFVLCKLLRFSFVPLFCSSDVSVPLSFLFSVLLLHYSFKLNIFRSFSVPQTFLFLFDSCCPLVSSSCLFRTVGFSDSDCKFRFAISRGKCRRTW